MQMHLPLLLLVMLSLLGLFTCQQADTDSDDGYWSYSSYNITVQYDDESQEDPDRPGLYVDVLSPYLGNDTFLFLGYRTPRNKSVVVFGNQEGVLAFSDTQHLTNRISFDNETHISYFVVKDQQEYSSIAAVKVGEKGKHEYLSAVRIGNDKILMDISGNQVYYTMHFNDILLIWNTTFDGSKFNLNTQCNKYYDFTPALSLLANSSFSYVPVRTNLNQYQVIRYDAGRLTNSTIVLGKEFIGDSEFAPITIQEEDILAMTISHQHNVYLVIITSGSSVDYYKVEGPSHKRYFLSHRSQIYANEYDTYFTVEDANDIVLWYIRSHYTTHDGSWYYSAPRQNHSAILLSEHIFLGKTIPSGQKVRVLPNDGSSSYLDFYYTRDQTIHWLDRFKIENEPMQNIQLKRTVMEGSLTTIKTTSRINNSTWDKNLDFSIRKWNLYIYEGSKCWAPVSPLGPNSTTPLNYSKLHGYSMDDLTFNYIEINNTYQVCSTSSEASTVRGVRFNLYHDNETFWKPFILTEELQPKLSMKYFFIINSIILAVVWLLWVLRMVPKEVLIIILMNIQNMMKVFLLLLNFVYIDRFSFQLVENVVSQVLVLWLIYLSPVSFFLLLFRFEIILIWFIVVYGLSMFILFVSTIWKIWSIEVPFKNFLREVLFIPAHYSLIIAAYFCLSFFVSMICKREITSYDAVYFLISGAFSISLMIILIVWFKETVREIIKAAWFGISTSEDYKYPNISKFNIKISSMVFYIFILLKEYLSLLPNLNIWEFNFVGLDNFLYIVSGYNIFVAPITEAIFTVYVWFAWPFRNNSLNRMLFINQLLLFSFLAVMFILLNTGDKIYFKTLQVYDYLLIPWGTIVVGIHYVIIKILYNERTNRQTFRDFRKIYLKFIDKFDRKPRERYSQLLEEDQIVRINKTVTNMTSFSSEALTVRKDVEGLQKDEPSESRSLSHHQLQSDQTTKTRRLKTFDTSL